MYIHITFMWIYTFICIRIFWRALVARIRQHAGRQTQWDVKITDQLGFVLSHCCVPCAIPTTCHVVGYKQLMIHVVFLTIMPGHSPIRFQS